MSCWAAGNVLRRRKCSCGGYCSGRRLGRPDNSHNKGHQLVGEEDQRQADDDFDDGGFEGFVGVFRAGDGLEGAQNEQEDGHGGGEARSPCDDEAQEAVEVDFGARQDGEFVAEARLGRGELVGAGVEVVEFGINGSWIRCFYCIIIFNNICTFYIFSMHYYTSCRKH